ncbi:TetR/AcrR family transcriptional regulator [Nonomuraea thailandensis]
MARKPDPRTRDRILNVASRLFQEHGPDGVGLQQIIDECGCGKNVLYREFGSKDDLVVAYLDRCRQEGADLIKEATWPLREDPVGQLIAIVGAVAERAATPDSVAALFATACPASPTLIIRRAGSSWTTTSPGGPSCASSPSERERGSRER